MDSIRKASLLSLVLFANASLVSCFVVPNSNVVVGHLPPTRISRVSLLGSMRNGMENSSDDNQIHDSATTSSMISRRAVFGTCLSGIAAVAALVPTAANADEYGRETEMAFLSTGETVMICTKRGPLGRCEKTERRTAENENDKSEKYFRQPTELVRRKDSEARMAESSEGNVLIERLKKQSEDNKEANDLLVYQRTLMNDSSASFGPFDGSVLILNEDGKGFTLLENPQAMRLKKAGFIEGKKFIKQPTQEEIDDALVAEPNILDKFFGGN